MKLGGSRTEANLRKAFAMESMARNKYTYYSSKARNEGYIQIANIFEETANNEKEHAKLWFKLIHDGNVPDTAANLTEAANGEHSEWSGMYARMARDARKDGFNEIAVLFENVAEIEKRHEERYLSLLKNLESSSVFSRPDEAFWICLNCGHIHEDKGAPDTCPTCNHPKAYFQLLVKDY